MNKTQLIENLSSVTNLSVTECRKVVDGLNFLIFDALKKGEIISFNNIGKFYIKNMPARQIKNPKTGRKYYVDKRKIVAFKISNNLKKSII